MDQFSTVIVASGTWTKVHVKGGHSVWVKHDADTNVKISVSIDDPNMDEPVRHKNVFEN